MIMPTPIEPEDLRPDQFSIVPNPPTERTATALLSLLAGTADVQGLRETELVNLRGAVLDEGTVGLFGKLERPGSVAVVDYIVGWHKAGDRGITAVLFKTEREAVGQYEATVAHIAA
jgi:hypothetical protein